MSGVSSVRGRSYRFPPLVRAGLFGAMPTAQVVTLLVSGAVAFVAVLTKVFLMAPLALLLGGVVAFKRINGWPMYERLPLRLAWWRRRRNRAWYRPIPLLGVTDHAPVELPPQLIGLDLLECDATWVAARGRVAGVGVVHDRTTGLVSAALRVHGDGQFALHSIADQDHRVGRWGDALAGFCREQCPVVRVVWQEWSASYPITPTNGAATTEAEETTPAAADYERLLRTAAPAGVRHDVVVTISIEIGRVRIRRRSGPRDARGAALQVLMEELRLFTGRLESAGLRVDLPLAPAELTLAVRERSHNRPGRTSGRGSLATALGTTVGDLAPMAVVESFGHVQVNGSLHRSYWIEGWPRLDVPASWMRMLLEGGNGTRTITVVFEPIAPSAAARAVDEAAVALEAAETAKAKRGFRIRASDRRKREEVAQREQELVAGFGDLAYAGFVHVTAPDVDTLDDLAADIEQTAAHVGTALRPLEGRHGAGWIAGLPLGRTVARRRGNLS